MKHEKQQQTELKTEQTQKTKKEKKQKKPTKEQQLETLKTELEEMKLNFLRARADYDNFRKRTQEDLMHARDRAIINFVEDLLPSIDNFEMSLKMTDNKEMFIKGVEMIHKNLTDTLKQHKFEKISATIGDDFNPTLHEPIPIEDETAQEGKVLNILKTGYKHKNKIVRPIKVNVKQTKTKEQ